MLTSNWRVGIFMMRLLTNLECLAQDTFLTLRLYFIKLLT
jgi:hypothetical protein